MSFVVAKTQQEESCLDRRVANQVEVFKNNDENFKKLQWNSMMAAQCHA